ncbi:ribonuclease H-like domain-containing protein [Tanacetum coccineum]
MLRLRVLNVSLSSIAFLNFNDSVFGVDFTSRFPIAVNHRIRCRFAHVKFHEGITNSTNDVSTAYGVSTSSGHNSQKEGSSSYTDELKYSFFANQSSGPQLDHEDLEQVDEFDLEEMDLKWQVAMISMRLKKFYKKTGRRLQFDAKEPVGFDKTKVECFNCHNTGHFARECRSKGNQESRRRDAGNTGYKAKDNGRRPGKQEEPKALVTLDGDGVDWTGHAEDEQENFALMAHSNSGSNTKVTSCSKECEESYAKLKKLYDEQREQLGVASIEIQAYTQALKKVEAQLVCHQQNQLIYEEKIRFMKIDLDDKTNVLTYHKKLLAEAIKEKEELKTKLENFQSSSKGLSKLLNSQMSTRDKSGLGYGNQIHEGVLSYEKEVLESLFDNQSSDVEDSHVNDRFAKVEGMHASKTSEFDAKTSDTASFESNSSVETPDFVPKPTVNEPTTVNKLKVWFDAPIIEEYESDNDDEYVIEPSKEQEKPSFCFVNTALACKNPRRTIRVKGKNTGQRENRPVWNNVQRLNHQNKFVPKAVLTKTGIFPVNTSRQNLSSQAAITSTARKVNTARPIVNTAGDKAVSAVRGIRETVVKPSAGCNWRPKKHYWNEDQDNPQRALKHKGIVDKDVHAHYWMRDKKNKVLFTDTECLVLSSDFKLPDENQVLLRIPRQNNMYSFNLEFSWVFFLRTKDETSGILKDFIRQIENQLNQKVKTIRCDNGTEFKNRDIIELCGSKGIKREYRLDAVCNVLLCPNGCHCDHLESHWPSGKFEGRKSDEGKGPNWLFDLDYLTDSMNYQPVRSEKQANKDFHHCLFACFLSQIKPKKISEALEDESWVDAMQEELLQFKLQKVSWLEIRQGWLPRDKWQEEGIYYDEVFAPVSRIEAIRIFLAFASYMGFIVYQMDVKSVFLYGTIDEEVYVSQPPGLVDPKFPYEGLQVACESFLYGYTKLLEPDMYFILLSWLKEWITEEEPLTDSF